jgi:hypothetical protein
MKEQTKMRIWLVVRLFLYAYFALFIIGFLSTYAKRFDDSHMEQAILEGGRLLTTEQGVFLISQCEGQPSSFIYNVDSDTLEDYTAAHAALYLTSSPITDLFPASKEDIDVAIKLIGGSVGAAAYLEKLRLAVTESEIIRRPIGFIWPQERGAPNKAVGEVVAVLGIVAGVVSGYFAGAYVAQRLGLDLDCRSPKMLDKLSNRATWHKLLAALFTEGFAKVSKCLTHYQLRSRLVSGRLIDYGKCNGIYSDLACKRSPESAKADLESRAKSLPPQVFNEQLAEAVVKREFPNEPERGAIGPTAADALVKTMYRLGAGKLINEKGQITIGANDVRLLLAAKATCGPADYKVDPWALPDGAPERHSVEPKGQRLETPLQSTGLAH